MMTFQELMEIRNAIDNHLGQAYEIIKNLKPEGTSEDPNKKRIREKAIEYMKEGNKLQAVKYVKEETGLGLKEAKEYCDELQKKFLE